MEGFGIFIIVNPGARVSFTNAFIDVPHNTGWGTHCGNSLAAVGAMSSVCFSVAEHICRYPAFGIRLTAFKRANLRRAARVADVESICNCQKGNNFQPDVQIDGAQKGTD